MVGIDEAGRGSLAGSMYIVGVKTPPDEIIEELHKLGLKDSKKLTPKKREKIFDFIKTNKKNFDIIILRITPKMIDEEGLSEIYKKSLKNIYDFFKNREENFVFDGNTLYGCNLPIKTEEKAEDKFIEVALASVIAKVKRDREIEKIAEKYPQYDWEKHKGYPQKAHTQAIKKYGILKNIHRESWKNIREWKDKFYFSKN